MNFKKIIVACQETGLVIQQEEDGRGSGFYTGGGWPNIKMNKLLKHNFLIASLHCRCL
jgi:hypothetical protein